MNILTATVRLAMRTWFSMAIDIQDLYIQKNAISQLSIQPIESLNRLVISRGYYANFIFAEQIVTDSKYQITQFYANEDGKLYGPHGEIYESLIAFKNNQVLNQIGYKLKKYHALRKKADYKISQDINESDIIDAENYFNDCKQLLEFFVKNPEVPVFTMKPKIIIASQSSSGKVENTTGLRLL